ncbi:hypothetical protein Tco_0093343 [Tanacetum coccineum]
MRMNNLISLVVVVLQEERILGGLGIDDESIETEMELIEPEFELMGSKIGRNGDVLLRTPRITTPGLQDLVSSLHF